MKKNRPDIFSERGELTKLGFLFLLLLVVFLVVVVVNAISIKGRIDNISDSFKSAIKQSQIYDTDKIIRARVDGIMRSKHLVVNPEDIQITRRNNMINLRFEYMAEFQVPVLSRNPTFKFVIEENTASAAE